MALPSQMDRSGDTARPFAARGRSGSGKLMVGGIALLLVAGGIVAIWQLGLFGTRTPEAGELSPSAAKADPLANTNPTPVPAPVSAPIGSMTPAGSASLSATPTVLTQGSTAAEPRPTDTPRPTPVDVTSPDLKPQPAPAGTTPAGTTPSGTTPTGTTPGLGDPSTSPSSAIESPGSVSEVRSLIDQGEQKLASGDPVAARALWSKALLDSRAGASDQQSLREKLQKLNEQLLFSPTVTKGDALVESYTVVSGDNLVRIARKRDLATDWRLIQRINKVNPNALRVGQKLKLVRGPFHAVVHKSEYRLDLFAGSPDEPSSWLFIRSFKVGLGEGNSTPLGTFVIRRNSKLVNPPWVNPRTGERFAADDAKNPIGEHWLGFEGLGESAAITGYGLHGTIDPDSIGKQASMGCVRMASDDIALMYELLVEQISTVKVAP
jgi:LysM repeat protein